MRVILSIDLNHTNPRTPSRLGGMTNREDARVEGSVMNLCLEFGRQGEKKSSTICW